MTASFCEKPTEIRERLNSFGSDDFGLLSFRSKNRQVFFCEGVEIKRSVLG
jgi:hypothetical protein